jgi:hypothetical protein
VGDPTDAEILAAPSDYTVEQVTAAFADATPEQIAEAQALERAGKNRSTITGYSLPVADEEPSFARERILSPVEGPAITGIPYPVIAGALAGDDASQFTRTEVRARAGTFLGTTVHVEEE